VQQLAIRLRTRPLKGTAPDAFGLLQQVTLDAPGLMRIIDNAGDGGSIYRELDAAARAWMEQGDARPILRLSAEQDTFSQDDPEAFSYGLYQAVICSDYPLLYDLRQPGSIRSRQYAQALADARAHRSGLFAPFSVDEALVSQMYITPLDSCLPWPAPPPNQAQGQPLPPSIRFPAVPTLVLSGDLDSVTSPQDAAQVTRQFPDAVHVVVPNLTHVVADADEIGCTLGLVQHFVDKLTPGDTACIQRVRAVRTVPRFARSYRDLAPLSRDVGDATSANQRRMAAAGLEAVGDALARYWPSLDSAGTGLRGGQFQYSSTNAGLAFKLTRYQFTDDVAASGRIAWNFNTSVITANVELWNGGRSVGTLNIRWTDSAPDAIATVTGTLGGSLLKAHRIAP
jgi:pimeloyl-ACP methyl ester carboxylesterase